jgi:hypothetical protein
MTLTPDYIAGENLLHGDVNEIIEAILSMRWAQNGDATDGDADYSTGSTAIATSKVWQWGDFNLANGATLTLSSAGVPLIAKVWGDAVFSGALNIANLGGAAGAVFVDFANGAGPGGAGAYPLPAPYDSLTDLTFTQGGTGGGRDDTGGNNDKSGSAGGGGASQFADGTDGSAGAGGGPAGGAKGTKLTKATLGQMIALGMFPVVVGGGGGAGGSPGGSGGTNASGRGGKGGGSAYFKICGNLTINATAVFNVSGENGVAGDSNANGWIDHVGPGAGGGAGVVLFDVAGTVTVNGSPTYTKTGGTGATNNGMTGGNGATGKILCHLLDGSVTVLA